MIKFISILLPPIKNDENMTLRYINDISRYEQARTSAVPAGEILDQGECFRVLVHVVTPTQRQDIAFPNLYKYHILRNE